MSTTVLSSQVATTASSTVSAFAASTARAASQGGIFQGLIPTHYDTKDPIRMFIIQAVIVITFTRILHWPLSKLRQPRVIAEVITGIVLGPSIMGRIPGFTQNIFPTASMPAFSLAANLGLVLFLFLVGLEVDLRFLASNWRVALSVGALGMAIPFGLGYAIAWGLYHQFHHEPGLKPISFGVYGLFIGIAIAITAFPVLCRILTSLRLLGTPVGVIVLSAGVANDVVGWVLLALCVTLVNAGGGLTTLWILLTAIGYSLFIAYPVRLGFMWALRKTGSLSNGPSQTIVALTLFLVLASAFVTDIIGIHPIFGAFMVGLICPHEGGFAIKITEKIEDLVSTLLLPLYFALSGLSTNLGLLDDGITWAYVIGVTAVAFFGKLGGGTFAAKLNGLLWGESITIGILMSCKGLVELIVLNIGLQAKILSTRTFTIFVVMALLTTFATTPLTMWMYPPAYQQKVQLWKQGKVDWNGNPIVPDENIAAAYDENGSQVTSKMLVYLRLDGLSSLHNIISLFTTTQPKPKSVASSDKTASEDASEHKDEAGVTDKTRQLSEIGFQRPLRIHGLRLMELTERDSSVMKVSELEEYATRDPVIKAFGTSAVASKSSQNITVSGQIAVVPEESFSATLVGRARETQSDFVLVPWSETGSVSEHSSLFDLQEQANALSSRQYATLTTDIYERASQIANVGVFIDKTLLTKTSTSKDTTYHSSTTVEPRSRQLTRSVTGISLVETNDQSVMFRSSDRRGRHNQIRALYDGHRDSLFAAKIALQFANHEDLDIKIISTVAARTSPTETSNSTTQDPMTTSWTSDHDSEYLQLRHSLPPHLSSRVTFEDLPTTSSEAIFTALTASPTSTPSPTSEITLILGRCLLPSHFTNTDATDPATQTGASDPPTTPRTHATAVAQPSASTSQIFDVQSRSLGPHAAIILSSMKDADVRASLLIVQARSNGGNLERGVVKRVPSRDSSIRSMH